MSAALRDGVVAGSVAAVLSGVPSTLHALATGADPLEPTLAAGSILLPHEGSRAKLVAAAVPVHLALSLTWGVALAHALPRRRGPKPLTGAAAGVAIHVLDICVAGRMFPRIRALPRGPQLADHVAFGAVVGVVLECRRR